MHWIEIIHLRAGNVNESAKVFDIINTLKDLLRNEKDLELRFFTNVSIFSDFIVVLEWKGDEWNIESKPLKSIPGMKLAESFSEIGIVNHDLFMEEMGKK